MPIYALLISVGLLDSLGTSVTVEPESKLRVATFNASLNRSKADELIQDLSTPDNAQARNVAEIIQHVRPDVLPACPS